MGSSSNVESSRNGVDAHQLVYPKPLAIHVAVVNSAMLFMETLITFHHLMGTEFYVPSLDGCFLNLHELYVQVTNRGGYEKVVVYKKWKEVSTAFKFFSTVSSVSLALEKHYSSLLYHYEQVHFFRLVEPSNNNSSGSEDNIPLIRGVDAKFDSGYMFTVDNDSQEVLHGVMYQSNSIKQSPTIPYITNTTTTSEPQTDASICTPTHVACNSTLASMLPTDEAAIILSIAPPSDIVLSLAPPSSTTMYAPPTNASSLSLAPPSYTMMFSPPANVGSNNTMTPSDNATSEPFINASSLFIAPPSNTMTYVPPAIVARNFNKKRFKNTTTSKPPTKTISLPLAPPSNTMIYAPPTNAGSNTIIPESPINASSISLPPPSNTMMSAPPTSVASNSAKGRFGSTDLTSKPPTKETTFTLAPPSITMMGAPTNASCNSTATRPNNVIISEQPPTNASSLSLAPASNTVMSAPLTNVASNSVATQSNTINLPEEHTEDPEPKRKRSHRDENRPKHPRSGYTYFLTQKQSELRSLHPNTRIGKITKMVGKAWTSMSKEEKKNYQNMGMADRMRYYKEKKEYQEKNNMNRV